MNRFDNQIHIYIQGCR